MEKRAANVFALTTRHREDDFRSLQIIFDHEAGDVPLFSIVRKRTVDVARRDVNRS